MQGAVTALTYSKDGALLASGSQDTDVVVWDVAGETGLFRLRGHLDQVTDLVCRFSCIVYTWHGFFPFLAWPSDGAEVVPTLLV